MNPRHKGSVKDRDLERYFPVRISIAIGVPSPAGPWSVAYSAMLDWLRQNVGYQHHAVLSGMAPGRPDTMRVLFATFDDARAFVERFEIPITTLGANPKQ